MDFLSVSVIKSLVIETLNSIVGQSYLYYNDTVSFGSNNDKATILFDTGSAFTAVNRKSCADCTNGPYDDSSSTTCKNVSDVSNFKVTTSNNDLYM